MKNFVKGMERTGRGFRYVSDAKIKECIFIGPQIRELMQDKQFDKDLNETEKKCMVVFQEDLQGLLRKSQSSELSG